MQTIEIDDSPASVAELLTKGHLHSWQDGKWRYSEWRAETVYCNDPTRLFAARASFANGYAGAADPDSKLFACIYPDGTRGVHLFDEMKERVLAQIYGPRSKGEAEFREWLFSTMGRQPVAPAST